MGSVSVARILGVDCKAGKVLFEMDGVTIEDAKEAMRLAAHKSDYASSSKEDIAAEAAEAEEV